MNNEQLNEILAQHLGYKITGLGNYMKENGDVVSKLDHDWTSDMNACLRDLLPLVREKGIHEIRFTYNANGTIACTLREYFYTKEIQAGATEPESFCKAVREVLRG